MKTLHIVLIAILIIGMAGIAPVAADLTVVSAGGVVFLGEEGLTFTGIPQGTTLEWFASGKNPATDPPSATYMTQGAGNEVIDPATFMTRTGCWYTVVGSPAVVTPIINVHLSSLDVKAYDTVTGNDMTNMRIHKGTKIAFRLDSNLYEGVLSRPGGAIPGQVTDINVVVVDGGGSTYTALVDNVAGTFTTPLRQLIPTTSQFYLPNSAGLGGLANTNWDLTDDQYKSGVYSFYAEVNLNKAKDNVGTVTGVTKTAVKTLEVIKDEVKIQKNKDTVVRNNDFCVTITGRPNGKYVLWVKGSNSIEAGKTAPFIKENQQGVTINDLTAGGYAFSGVSGGTTVATDVCTVPASHGGYYAMVTLSSSGTRTVGFGTDASTKDQIYTIRSDLYKADTPFNPVFDTTKVKVEKGDVTITASGDNSYYIGEKIIFSGTNTDSGKVWLFITGPNLATQGAPIFDTRDGVRSFNAVTNPLTLTRLGVVWAPVSVETDDTWEYKWNTLGVNLDAGVYTIYAVTTPTNKNDLVTQDAVYATKYVAISKPFITATTSSATIAKGDKISILGTATGDPTEGIAIWIFGKNYVDRQTETVEDDGSFEFSNTINMPSGQYFIVVQHPMENDRFDLVVVNIGGTTWVQKIVSVAPFTVDLFSLDGPGSLQGSEAATALVNAMNSPDIDDTCYKLTFMVEEPWIVIDAIGDKHVGDTFTISGTTNLAPHDKLSIWVNSKNGIVPGSLGTAQVSKGKTDVANIWTFILDTSTYTPGDYTITTEWIGPTNQNATQTFTLLEAEENPQSPHIVTRAISPGWNLISTPVNTPSIDVTGYLYETIYAYNAITGTYKEVLLTDIVPGEGYWIGAFADAEIEFTGTPVTKYQKSLATGWNLVGGIGIETDVRSINMNPKALSGPIYYYNTRTHLYSQATSLEPGQGYWISTSEPCTINVNITPTGSTGIKKLSEITHINIFYYPFDVNRNRSA